MEDLSVVLRQRGKQGRVGEVQDIVLQIRETCQDEGVIVSVPTCTRACQEEWTKGCVGSGVEEVQLVAETTM